MQKIPKSIRDTISFLLCQIIGFTLVLVFIVIGVEMTNLLEIIGWENIGTITIMTGLCIWLWFIVVDQIIEIIVDKLY